MCQLVTQVMDVHALCIVSTMVEVYKQHHCDMSLIGEACACCVFHLAKMCQR